MDIYYEIKKNLYSISIKNNLNLLINSTQEISDALLQISKGNIDISLQERSSNDILIRSLNTTIKSLQDMINDIQKIATAAAEGQLNVRADASKH